MKKITIILILSSWCISFSQVGDTAPFGSGKAVKYIPKKHFYSIEEALKNPEEVYILKLYDQGFAEFPEEIFNFTNLEQLHLIGNLSLIHI